MTCQHFDDRHTSVNQCFPSDHCVMIYYTCIKDLFKVQYRPIDFNIPEYRKLIDLASDSTSQLILFTYFHFFIAVNYT